MILALILEGGVIGLCLFIGAKKKCDLDAKDLASNRAEKFNLKKL